MEHEVEGAQRGRRTLSVVVLALSVVAAVLFGLRAIGTPGMVQHVLFVPVTIAYPLVAMAILWRRNHPIGWLLLVIGAVLVSSDLGDVLLRRPTPPGTSVPWRLAVTAAALPFPLFAALLPSIGFRFPTGRPVSGRWRWAERVYILGVLSLAGAMLLTEQVRGGTSDGATWTLANPLWSPTVERVRVALELTAGATLAPAIVLALAALVVRFRRATGVERQQLRWLVVPIGVVLLSWPLVAGSVLLIAGWDATGPVSAVYPLLLLGLPPVGMGVAITRHGLYDLQRLVSRTVSYAALSFLLAMLYASMVVVIGGAARTVAAGSGDLVVAVSTLAVAAAFGPLRRRVQRLVDRRFNRRQVDAATTLEAFTQRLRDEVDLDLVASSLRDTVAEALSPRSAAVVLFARPGDATSVEASVRGR